MTARWILLPLAAGVALAEPAAAPHPAATPAEPSFVPAAVATAPAANREMIEHGGQRFELATNTCSRNVETHEYVLAGESTANWTQLVTVQRVTLAGSSTAGEFVTFFRTSVAEEGASLDVVKVHEKAAVFAVRFPAADRNDEQVMMCLAFVDRDNPSLLNVVQYAVKPTRSPVERVSAQLSLWRDKFLQQAQVLGGDSGKKKE